MNPDEVHAMRFRRQPIGRRGYGEDEVDQLLDRIEDTLRGRPRITRDELVDYKHTRSPILARGYREEDVESFIQRVIAEWPAS
jgi:DivIVA domain-containing protein